MLGVYARETGLVKRIGESNKVVSYVILFIIPVLIFLYNDTLAPYFNCSRPYAADGGNEIGFFCIDYCFTYSLSFKVMSYLILHLRTVYLRS